MPLDKQTEELFSRIRKKCQDRGWFGGDEWMDPGFSNPPPFKTAFAPPATEEQLQRIEHELGFPLPSLLRNLYLHLANGDYGFGYGILSAENMLHEYQSSRAHTFFDGAWHWPEHLVPLCYWGCNMHSYLDVALNTILFADTDLLFNDEGSFLIEAPSFSAWLERWLTKQDRYPVLSEQDDDVDELARTMGLESLEDDPNTPVPPYVRKYQEMS